jgi:Glycine zipper 2TM domain
MTFKITKFATAAAMALSAVASATPALANHDDDEGYNRSGQYQNYGYDKGYGRGYNRQSYDDGRDYRRNYDDRDGRYRCNRGGTTGLIVGAIAGGLLGRSIAGHRGDGTAGFIIGGGVGALAGRAIERGGNNHRC